MLAVVGPTATGKTALGVALAEAFEGEVISADSMQIYKGLDVGTAKVAPDETHGVPHHAVDILEPDELFSVADFVTLAGTLEADISARGRLPILVGGTGLYVQSFLYGVRFAAEKTPDGLREQLAAELAEKGPEAMYKELQAADPEAAAATVNIASWLTVIMVLPVLLATVAVLAIAPCPSAPFPLFAPACAGMPVRLRFPATADGLRGVVVGAVAAFVVERADPGCAAALASCATTASGFFI